MTRDDILKRIIETARKVLPRHARIILFGSHARGDAQDNSDWDLLVLIDKKGRITERDFTRYAYPLVDLGWTLNAEINPLIYTNEEWERRKITPFYKNVSAEGMELLCR